jgi:hypothetical protein
MLAIFAAIIFAIAFVLRATSTTTDALFSPDTLLLVGLAILALHVAGLGSGWKVPRRRRRR